MTSKRVAAGLMAPVVSLGLALGLTLSLATATPAAAAGKDRNISIEQNHLNVKYNKHESKKHHYWHYKSRHDKYRKHHKYQNYNVCTSEKAMHKARKKGLYHARVEKVGYKYVMVKGRSGMNRIKVAFYRDSPRCKVAWVDRSPTHYRGKIRY